MQLTKRIRPHDLIILKTQRVSHFNEKSFNLKK